MALRYALQRSAAAEALLVSASAQARTLSTLPATHGPGHE